MGGGGGGGDGGPPPPPPPHPVFPGVLLFRSKCLPVDPIHFPERPGLQWEPPIRGQPIGFQFWGQISFFSHTHVRTPIWGHSPPLQNCAFLASLVLAARFSHLWAGHSETSPPGLAKRPPSPPVGPGLPHRAALPAHLRQRAQQCTETRRPTEPRPRRCWSAMTQDEEWWQNMWFPPGVFNGECPEGQRK